MGRAGNPPAYELERAGVFIQLVDEARVGLYDAEQWLRAWEVKAEELGRPRTSDHFWVEGLRWILGELDVQRRATS